MTEITATAEKQMRVDTRKRYSLLMSDAKRIVVNGRLKGMDRDIPCKISGRKISRADSTVFEMTDLGIIDPPKGLPDGIYELDYEGSAERFTKTGDLWQLL
jgi:hypothetical protein